MHLHGSAATVLHSDFVEVRASSGGIHKRGFVVGNGEGISSVHSAQMSTSRMKPVDALRAATSASAECLGVGSECLGSSTFTQCSVLVLI